MPFLLGLDIGTTTIKAILYDPNRGQVVRVANRPTPTRHPQPGWSEHDPEELWQTLVDCIREAANGEQVTALAISSMAEAGVLLDGEGRPTLPIIAWYDRRSEPQAAWIEQQVNVESLYRITGQRASPSFGITKLLWLRENQPEAYASARYWLPVPAYLCWRLCGERAVDYTIAARTLVFDQHSLDWSTALCELFGLSPALIPPVYPGGTPVGSLTAQAAAATGMSTNTLCVLGGHDHLCAALAAGAHAPGSVTDSTGSANALLLLLPHFLPNPEQGRRGYACYAYVLKDLYALKGGLKAAGSAVEWLARQLSAQPERPAYAELEAEAAQRIGQRAGPVWLPHLIGSGTPEGDRFSKAALVGAQFEQDRGDLFRGMLESLAFWLRHNLEEMEVLTGLRMETVSLIGGTTRLKLLSQLKADVLRLPMRIPQIPEAAATGAALLAGLGAQEFTSPAQAAGSLQYLCEIVEPDPARSDWYDMLYQDVYLKLYEALKPINLAIERLDRKAGSPNQ